MDNVINLPPRTRRGTYNGITWEVKYVPHVKKYTWCVIIPRDPLYIADSAETATDAEAMARAAIRAYQKNAK